MTKKVLKKFPPGTDLRHSDWDHFAIWGDWMARVDQPSDYSQDDFDPELVARRYYVYLTDIPATRKLLGVHFDFKYGNRSIHEQPFYFRREVGWMRADTGHMQEPVEYWVLVNKFSDLIASEDAALQRVLNGKGYVRVDRYALTKTKWVKLLGMSFAATQDLADYEIGNAAYEALEVFVGGGRAFGAKPLEEYSPGQEQEMWEKIPGIYTTTRKNYNTKWVVSRKPSKKGL